MSLFERKYSLEETFGLSEIPPDDCPTYIDRQAHKNFQYAIEHEKCHIVVYGASRQGKTWLVEKYAPRFVRVGCDAKCTREILFKSILSEAGFQVGTVQTDEGEERQGELKVGGKGSTGIPLLGKAEIQAEGKLAGKNSSREGFTFINVDLTNQAEVVTTLKRILDDRFIVIENFHYLEPEVQKAFASSLREFYYHNIRVIIVGVWKETTKLVSMAPDLSNRVEPIDIGDWSLSELAEIVKRGEKALKIEIPDQTIQLFIENSGRNVGMFKSLLKNFCKLNLIFETQDQKKVLDNEVSADEAVDKSFQEVVVPALDRLKHLARSRKSGGKGLRYYIIRALLDIIAEKEASTLLKGIGSNEVVNQIHSFGEDYFLPQNIKQELSNLHLREETVPSEGNVVPNFIPLFYYDQGKDKVFLVDSALLAAKKCTELKTLLGPKTLYVK